MIDFGGGTNCQISYTADYDGDGKSNDVALYNFYAPQQPVIPAVDNGVGVTNLLATSCYLNGNVSQGTPAPDVYVCYGLTSAGDSLGAWDHVVYVNPYAGTGPFSIRVIQLQPGSSYYYRCFATNSAGSAWSPVSNFVTPTAATLIWTNTAWGADNTTYSWYQAGNWSNRLPACAGDTGYIPSGRTASPSGDLGTTGDRPTIVAQAGSSLYMLTDVLETPLVLSGGTLDFNYHMTSYGGAVTIVSNALIRSGELDGNGDHFRLTGTMSGATGCLAISASEIRISPQLTARACASGCRPGPLSRSPQGFIEISPLATQVRVKIPNSRPSEWCQFQIPA